MVGVGSGGGFEGDFVAEGLEFADVVAGSAVEVDAGFVVVGSELDEPGVVVREQWSASSSHAWAEKQRPVDQRVPSQRVCQVHRDLGFSIRPAVRCSGLAPPDDVVALLHVPSWSH